MENTQIKAVIFDVDGTLVDSIAVGVIKMQIGADLLGLAFNAEEQARMKAGWGAHLSELFPLTFGDSCEPHMVKVLEEVFISRDEEYPAPAIDGARDVLELLASNGIALTVASSREGVTLMATLKRENLECFFCHVVAGDTRPHRKPHPDTLQCTLELFEQMGVRKEEMLIVGDAWHDIDLGKNTGIRTVIVRTGAFQDPALAEAAQVEKGIDFIDSIADLPAWFARNGQPLEAHSP